jgi:hypothetical protein
MQSSKPVIYLRAEIIDFLLVVPLALEELCHVGDESQCFANLVVSQIGFGGFSYRRLRLERRLLDLPVVEDSNAILGNS